MTQGKPINLMLRLRCPWDDRQYFPVALFHGGLPPCSAASSARTRWPPSVPINVHNGLILLLATGVTSAISIVLSQYVGANDTDRVRKERRRLRVDHPLLGVVLGLISVFAARPLMQL